MTFGEKIKKIMKDNDLTQKQFAEKIGTKHSAISRWIKGGSKNPTLETIEKISSAFKVPTSFFIDDNENINLKSENIIIGNNHQYNLPSVAIEEIKKLKNEIKIYKKELLLKEEEIKFLKDKNKFLTEQLNFYKNKKKGI